jgi:hypothetical protein
MTKKNDIVVGRVAFGPPKKVLETPANRPVSPASAPLPEPLTVNSLLPRQGRFPVSRDHDLGIIECRVSECPANQHDRCSMPSCIKIGIDGKCELGEKARQKAREAK